MLENLNSLYKKGLTIVNIKIDFKLTDKLVQLFLHAIVRFLKGKHDSRC